MDFKKTARIPRRHILAAALTALVVTVLLALIPTREFSVTGEGIARSVIIEPITIPQAEPIKTPSPFTGVACRNGRETPHRPVAIMLAGDDDVRPLAGIGAADLVVEMPVVTWGINRLMAVFTCGGEFEIGSVRSARDDFIPLAAAFDGVFGHWGGSYLALNELNRGVIDNIDALPNPFSAYYRKPGIPAPDNGFTTLKRQRHAAEQFGYRTELLSEWRPFVHVGQGDEEKEISATRIEIGYFGPYAVHWEYDGEIRRYMRTRGKREEIDVSTGENVSTATVIVMRTNVVQRYGEYNDVRVTGGGEAVVYAYGQETRGRWEKAPKPLGAPLSFLDESGDPIPFAEGPVWIEIVQLDTPVTVSGTSAPETETPNPKL